ncbi:plasmid stabilization system family protein [Neisseria musculi]|uniref:Plasmid stabilization system family protein n=2 Tax=Neisseria musculi TaxID=1815583 RepID=A0A7H1M8Z9_9NEIS|nr:plasmid stabilization system family protein [Neisseria musculi]QNT59289.1 plasmid stabilization system family protein [Neisseria musculi]
MKIIWSGQASGQLDKLLDARKDFAGMYSAQKAFQEIERLLDLAASQPYMGKPGMIENTRELYPLRYRIVYTVSEKHLTVVAVLPQWQKWPDE